MKKINTVTMVRGIRDKQSNDTAGMSTQEIIDYFHKKADGISKKVKEFEIKQR